MSDSKLSVLDILKLLNKSNCGDCGVPSCMAFAVQMLQQNRPLGDCPHVAADVLQDFNNSHTQQQPALEQQLNVIPNLLKERVQKIDFNEAAPRLKAEVVDDRLVIRCLGRNFYVDQQGELYSESHTNFWVHLPILNYIYYCKGRELTNEWVKFDNLKNAMSFSNYFASRCEARLKDLADKQTDLFFDLLDLFGGRPASEDFTTDLARIIYPLPRIPMLISYWPEEEEFESKLSVYFDRATQDNLDIESLYVMGMGLVGMFTNIITHHGFLQE